MIKKVVYSKIICSVGLMCAGGAFAVPSEAVNISSTLQVIHKTPRVKISYVQGSVPPGQTFVVGLEVFKALSNGDITPFSKTAAFKALAQAFAKNQKTVILFECSGGESFGCEVRPAVKNTKDPKNAAVTEVIIYGMSKQVPSFVLEIVLKSAEQGFSRAAKIAGAFGTIAVGAAFVAAGMRGSKTQTPAATPVPVTTPAPVPTDTSTRVPAAELSAGGAVAGHGEPLGGAGGGLIPAPVSTPAPAAIPVPVTSPVPAPAPVPTHTSTRVATPASISAGGAVAGHEEPLDGAGSGLIPDDDKAITEPSRTDRRSPTPAADEGLDAVFSRLDDDQPIHESDVYRRSLSIIKRFMTMGYDYKKGNKRFPLRSSAHHKYANIIYYPSTIREINETARQMPNTHNISEVFKHGFLTRRSHSSQVCNIILICASYFWGNEYNSSDQPNVTGVFDALQKMKTEQLLEDTRIIVLNDVTTLRTDIRNRDSINWNILATNITTLCGESNVLMLGNPVFERSPGRVENENVRKIAYWLDLAPPGTDRGSTEKSLPENIQKILSKAASRNPEFVAEFNLLHEIIRTFILNAIEASIELYLQLRWLENNLSDLHRFQEEGISHDDCEAIREFFQEKLPEFKSQLRTESKRLARESKINLYDMVAARVGLTRK